MYKPNILYIESRNPGHNSELHFDFIRYMHNKNFCKIFLFSNRKLTLNAPKSESFYAGHDIYNQIQRIITRNKIDFIMTYNKNGSNYGVKDNVSLYRWVQDAISKTNIPKVHVTTDYCRDGFVSDQAQWFSDLGYSAAIFRHKVSLKYPCPIKNFYLPFSVDKGLYAKYSKINYFFQKTLRLFLIIFSFDVIASSTLNIDFKESAVSSFSILKDSFGNGRLTGNELGKIPKANIDLIINPNGEVIPRKQGLIETDNKFWNILFEPGKWYLKDKRISIVLPFALIEKGQNCTHQGLLIIENDNAGYQIASETCIYFQFISQGQVDITIKSIDLPNSDEILAKHTNYVANRMPTKSIADLALVNEQLKENIFSQDFLESQIGLLKTLNY